MDYNKLLTDRMHFGCDGGFEPIVMPDHLFGFQSDLVQWSLRKGRSAIFADCGLGKTAMQLAWAENVIRKTNKPVLILTPLAVGSQTVKEAVKFGHEAVRSLDGKHSGKVSVVANYERLHYFNPEDFAGVVCDESSILKNADGVTKQEVTQFLLRVPYRLLATATAAPNDFIELGTSSEALGYLGFQDMITKFFKKVEKTTSRKEENMAGTWRFRGHAEELFWKWVCSWARAIRRPSDMGYSDDGYDLPPVEFRQHIVSTDSAPDGFLFALPACGLSEQRNERKRTLEERCELAASLVNGTGKPFVSWCYLNSEGDLMEKLIPDAEQVSGGDPDEKKEELFNAFSEGQIRGIITKPKIAGFGLNWQHCAHQTWFPSHSFEQLHQGVSRSNRFGQKNRVIVDLITSEGEAEVLKNIKRKQLQAEEMFARLVELMNQGQSISETRNHNKPITKPSWLQ